MIRHASTEAIDQHILAGRAPNALLSSKGRSELATLAKRVAGNRVGAVYSSPLERAVDTAKAVAGVDGLTVETMEEFIELDLGEWTGRNFDELHEDSKWKRFNSFRSSVRIPGGETLVEVQCRVFDGLEKLRAKHPDETVAVVSHADVIKAGITYFAGIPIDLSQRIEISPASVSRLEIGDDHVSIKYLNML